MKRFLPLTLFVVALGIATAAIVSQSGTMPARVATHFDGAGRPNGWMARPNEARFFILTALGTACFVAAVGQVIRFFPPETLNVPRAAFWRAPENYARACRFLARACLVQGAFLALWLAGLHGLVGAANRQVPVELDGKGMEMLLAVFLVEMAVWIGTLAVYFSKRR